jgi:CheY-like chemotaxis protein
VEKPFVLVADDNEATCTLITALLRRDFTVDAVNDGADAIAKLKNRQYAAIVLDLRMPQVDGYGVLDFLLAERPSMLRQVLVVTASLGPRELERVRAYEVCQIVPKPFEIDELLELVRQCAGVNGDGAGLGGTILHSGMIFLIADLLR